ncbi:N-formylglutamate amidohydrolase [Rhodoligotrophos defluvii]|uniref:N-formylglutamate amidohydrolase n=1 Tax=Rhodoligotrophos defluvii TaxID=2561934 RepID=UPI0010C9C0DC|nr:N-formylglutamate amidohydrolase [Rhodoligotrophos defluvii]
MGSEAFIELVGGVERGLLLVCDHARNTLPPEYGTLGLPESELARHIAYDIGAEALTRALAARLGAPAVLSCFSRLLIDPNRGEDDPTLIMRLSDGSIVPGNARVDAAERLRRLERFYRPYHQAIDGWMERIVAAGRDPVVLSIHSFTPSWKGVPRPWHVGLLWDRDERLSRALVAALRAEPGLVVGENEPYRGGLDGDTMDIHCTRRGLSHALIEVRQDLIADEAGAEEWAERLARLLPTLLKDKTLTGRIRP